MSRFTRNGFLQLNLHYLFSKKLNPFKGKVMRCVLFTEKCLLCYLHLSGRRIDQKYLYMLAYGRFIVSYKTELFKSNQIGNSISINNGTI